MKEHLLRLLTGVVLLAVGLAIVAGSVAIVATFPAATFYAVSTLAFTVMAYLAGYAFREEQADYESED